ATIAAMIGNALEHYDMSLYGFMVPILISIFLPSIDKLNALILTFVFSPISIIVRPIGAITIGRLGDKYGRKTALIVSIGGMAIATGAIGLLPTYSSVGIWAPILFLFLRSMQGFFVAGESCGGAVFVLEHSDSNKGYLSGLYVSYAVVGMVAAALMATLTTYLPEKFWRVPYLIGSLTGLIGFYLRSNVSETPSFLKYKNVKPVKTRELFKRHKSILVAIGVSGLFSALYLLPTYLMISLLPIITSFKLSTIMTINMGTTILYMISLPFFGKLADRISITRSMLYASVTVIILSYPLISLISYDNLYCIILMKLCFALLTAWLCSPFYAWIHTLFHTKERYTAVSLSFSIGGQLGGFMVPLTIWLWKNTESLASIYGILIFWGVISTISLFSSIFLAKHD
ncbi:MAG: MFS transporter, partial [Gammaproteobacteria bacterium]|nr:MFS transporter [Gammaproteobacteria bacterium]